MFTVAASTAWFAPELADAVVALGARHGGGERGYRGSRGDRGDRGDRGLLCLKV